MQDNYDSSEIYFLASVLNNNSYSETTKTTAAEIIFGARSPMLETIEQGGKFQPVRTFRLSEEQRQDVVELRKTLSIKVREAQESADKAKKEYVAKVNESRKNDHGLSVGDLVFAKNMLPASGNRPIKWRPTFHRSPFVVVHVHDHNIVIRRLADDYETILSSNVLRPYKEGAPEFEELPDEVLKIVGRPLTEEALKELARIDQLDPIYLVEKPAPPEPVQTRSKTRTDAAAKNNVPSTSATKNSQTKNNATVVPKVSTPPKKAIKTKWPTLATPLVTRQRARQVAVAAAARDEEDANEMEALRRAEDEGVSYGAMMMDSGPKHVRFM